MVTIGMLRKNNEQGFAAIVIALTLITVLVLMTVGFAQLARHEQRNALNKQLSTQAYYAAESGINDATADIAAGNITAANTNCSPNYAGTYTPNNKVLNTTLDVSYTCVSVDLTPSTIEYKELGDSSSKTVTFSSASGAPIDKLTISWSSNNGNSSPPPTQQGFLSQDDWTANKYPAVIEANLTPLNVVSRPALVAASFTTYGYPVSTTGTQATYGPSTGANEGLVNNAGCVAATKICTLIIGSLTSNGNATYLLHLTDHYDLSHIFVTAVDAAGGPIKFKGAQAVIDSTGKSRDVLKRLQVRLPLDKSNVLSNYAIEAQNVCKRLTTYPITPTTSTDVFHAAGVGETSPAPAGDPCNLD